MGISSGRRHSSLTSLAAVFTLGSLVGCSASHIDISGSSLTSLSNSGAPGTPTVRVSAVNSGSVTLGWDVVPSALSYTVYRTVPGNPNYTVVTGCTGITVNSCTNTGLSNGSTYLFAIKVTMATGVTGYSNQVSAIPQVRAPNAPTGLSGTASDSDVDLVWDATAGASSYTVQRSLTQGSGFTNLTNCTSTYYNSCSDTTAVNGKTYYYRVSASNAGGTSAYSNTIGATPQKNLPGAPTLSAQAGDGKVTLVWSTISDATSYVLLRSSTSGAEADYKTDLSGTSYTDTSVINGLTYYYQLLAVNSSGRGNPSQEVSATPQVATLSPPTGLNGASGNAKAILTWQAVTNATYYSLYRSLDANTYTKVAACSGTSFSALTCTDTGLINGTYYYYRVATGNAGGEGTPSSYVYVLPNPPPPAAPTGVSATGSSGKISVSWTAVSGATSYSVYRSLYADYNYSAVSACSGSTFTATTCADTSVTNGTAYFYKVISVNSGGQSIFSDPAASAVAADFTFAYSPTSYKMVIGSPWTAVFPSNTNGHTLLGCSVSPSLPSGLSLSAEGCGIIGTTPSYPYATTKYLLSGKDSDGKVGSSSITLTFTVPPPVISYASRNAYPAVNELFDFKASNTGGWQATIETCTITPDLPTGVSMDANCNIKGTFTSESAPVTYTIKASNAGGSSSFGLTIEVLKKSVIAEIMPAYQSSGTMVRMANGNLYAWQNRAFTNLQARVNKITDYYANLSNYSTDCMLLTSGKVECEGNDQYGVLGNGSGSESTSNYFPRGPITLDAGEVVQTYLGGSYYGCVLLTSGKVKCWGYNHYGSLGVGSDPTYINVPTAVALAADEKATSIEMSGYSVCAILSTGKVKCWGSNSYGELGNNTTTNSNKPVLVGLGTSDVATKLVGGPNHFCAILSTGKVKCWGSNYYGQLGNGTTINSVSTPTSVVLNTNDVVTDLFPLYYGYCAIVSSGLKCWGYNSDGVLGNGSADNKTYATPALVGVKAGATVTSFSQSSGTACALLSTGEVQCWGKNTNGLLGLNPTTYPNSGSPQLISGLTSVQSINVGSGSACALTGSPTAPTAYCWGGGRSVLPTGEGPYGGIYKAQTVIGVSATASLGKYQKCAVLTSGQVKCWGYGENGELGNGTSSSSSTPVSVSLDASDVVTSLVSSSGSSVCALLSTGAVKCWGYGGYGQLGTNNTNSSYKPISVQLGASDVATAIVAAGNRSDTYCALLSSGAVKCWGYNNYGQAGSDSAGYVNCTPTTVGLSSGDVATSIVGGTSSFCVTLSAGGAKCWGYGYYGALGNGLSSNSTTPVSVIFGQNDKLTSIQYSPGMSLFCGIFTTGKVKCWGINDYGELGNGQSSNYSTPVSLRLDSNETVTQLSLNNHNNCALLNTGKVKCWGMGGAAIGDGVGSSGAQAPTLIALSAGETATQIENTTDSQGNTNYCALLSTGKVKCWGKNQDGELGNATTTASATPTLASIPSNETVTSLTSIDLGFCASIQGGTVRCWGLNSYGTVGSGTSTLTSTPSLVSGVTDSKQIVNRGSAVCSVSNSGTIQCWGDNSSYGFLGNGQEDYLTSPKKTLSP